MFGSGRVTRETFDLNQALQDVIGLIAGELETQGVSLETELSDGLPPVLAGRVEVQQVLMNLLLNAQRAVSRADRPVIRLGSRREGEQALVWVQDSGAGVPADRLHSIFDSFATTKPDGLGMGLAISRRIVEAHGGRIEVESEGPGRGSTFRFTLPPWTAAGCRF